MPALLPPPHGDPPDPDPPPDPRLADLVALVDALVDTQRRINALAAERYRALDALRQRWEDTFGASMSADPAGIRFRSMRAQIAATLLIPERTVETMLHTARRLIHDLPATFERFSQGRIAEQHARILSDAADGLTPVERAELQAQALPYAEKLAPAKFERKVRTLKARIHPEDLEEKRNAAFENRELRLEPASDGMAWLHLYLAAEDAVAAYNRADVQARHLAGPDEARTVSQLRADVLRDLLLDDDVLLPPREGEQGLRAPSGKHRGIVPTVHVTVPVLTLNGTDDTPAVLDGYGPIDPATARRLAGLSTGFHRILTHPDTGVMLSFGRSTYPPPKELRRYVITRDGTCRSPGCNRDGRYCDLDHTRPWIEDGETDANNLAALCPNHHRVKHDGGWKVEHDEHRPGVLNWTSPIGITFTTEPTELPATRRTGGRIGKVLVQTECADPTPEDQPPF